MAEARTGCITILKWIWTQVKRRFSYTVENSQDRLVAVDMEASASLPSSSSAVQDNQVVVDMEASASLPSSSSAVQDNQVVVSMASSASLPSSAESSSSSSTARPCKYDVFLSFRGPDTRRVITSQLYDQLHKKRRIATFMDEPDLEVGDAISPTLLKAIEESRFAIVVLSPNYASSTWCLEELAKICDCMKDHNRILPLFYNVEPTDVRHQKGSFEEALNKHESSGRHTSEKVQRWKDALSKVASFSGWDSNNYKTDTELVEKIVDTVFKRIQPFDVEFTMSTRDFEAYEATTKTMGEVMKKLKDDNVTAIAVYGMGGVGKTTLVKHVAAQSCKNGIFHHVIMAVVSENPNFERIQHTLLAELLGPDFKVKESERASRLYKEIMRKDNILIILDDIWDFIDLSGIGIPSYDLLKKCNSKVLITTRKSHVCNSMDILASIPLHFLSEPDSWSLFVKKTRRSFDTPDFDIVARKVARECGGLPIALIAVARALGDKDLAEWHTAAQQLKKSQKAGPDHDDTAFKCLKLSYDYLKNEDYKSYFLLCCLFPEDYDIPIEDVFKYAIGKGLFRGTDTIYEARGIADTVVKHLIDSSLLLDGKYRGYVRIHDVVRDTAMRIAFEGGHEFLVRAGFGIKECRSHEDYYAISLMGNELHSLPEELIGPKLKILLLQENQYLNEIPDTFSQSPNELRVLDLSRTNVSLLPQSFNLLTKLQALHLDFCRKAVDISIVGKLKKLQILSMRQYPLTVLSREIGNLTNLRMLDIGGRSSRGGGIVTIPSEVISKLHRLEELYMMYCGFVRWKSPIEGEGDEIDIGFGELAGLSKLKNLQVSLPNAECIPKNVEVEPGWLYFDIRIGGRTSGLDYQFDRKSRSLLLREITISTLPDWFIKAVTEKTEKLEYDCCKGMSDIVMEYDRGRLHKLKHLTVAEQQDELKELMNTIRRVETGPVFENLEELHLLDLSHLEQLCVGELPPRSLFNLKVFQVSFCHMLKNVSRFVQRLPNLEKLDLRFMDQLEYVFRCKGFEPEQPKLREMHLLCLEALRSICNGPTPQTMFQSLKILTIYRCELLQSLFASDVAQCLVQLEDLLVERCPLLERVMEAVNKEKTVLPKLKNLVLKELPLLYGASGDVDIECPSLEHFIVVDCAHIPFSITYSRFYSFKSRSRLSFSTSASDYIGGTYIVQLNDIQQYYFLRGSKVPIESTGDFQAFETTRQAMGEVMKALIDDHVTTIGVYGMGGVGKTTLVKHVAAKCRKSGIFHDVIMAVVSQNLDLKKIQDTLADLLGFKLKKKTEAGRADKLHKEIMRKEKLLIIVDDVWERTELSKIGIPSYKELQKRKCKVLLTTRRLNVCLAMNCQEKISLNVLSEEDSLTLFLRNARIVSFESISFEKVVKRVAADCKGLPIALIAVARALKDKDLAEWEKAAQGLEKSQSANPDYEEDAFKCMKLSYDCLKDEEYKSFFLLCCLFPEDYDINIEVLFRYAIGIGLFRDAETINEARGTAYTVVKYLKDSSLLLKCDYLPYRHVRMHDVVRDTALNIANSEGHRFLLEAGCGLDDWPSRLLSNEGCTAISLMRNRIRKLPPQMVCPKLQILLLNQNSGLDEIPETFFQSANELRVLDLSYTDISLLPQSFGLLTNLRALYLDFCENLTDISVVGKITTLEVLSVQCGGLKELSREIGNLTNLRVLDITGGAIVRIPSKLLSKLHSLEELYLCCEFGDWGSKVDGEGDETNSAFDEVTGLSKLRILHVWISNEECIPKLVELNPNWVGFFIRIGKDEEGLSDFYKCYQDDDIDQRTIFLELDSISNFPDWFFNTVINKAETLWWYDCPRTGLIDVFVEYERGRLHCLKQLEVHGEDNEDDLYGTDDEDLYGTDDEDDLMNTSTWVPKGIPKKKTWVPKEPLFENLEVLDLSMLDCGELCAVEFLQPGSLCNLKSLNVFSCYNWGNVLLPSTLLERLLNLEELQCSWMDKIEYVFGYEAALPETEQSKLRKIRLVSLERVRSLCEGPAPPAMFQNLQTLSITECSLQGSLFTYDVAQCLSQLNSLDLDYCPLLERIVEASNKKIILPKLKLPKLKQLHLTELPVLYCESATFDIECPSLEAVFLQGCPKFSVSVPDFHSEKQVLLYIR